jgi:RNase adaptor protein for sRNA GlmZ degradation
MIVSTLKKNISFLTDSKGQKVAVQFDLRNQQMQDLFEDLIDTITVLERQDEPTRTFEEVKKEILAQRANVNV